METEKAAGFVTSKNLEKKAVNKTMIQKILCKSKFALLFVKVYSEQTYGYYQNYICYYDYVFDTRPTIYRLNTDCVL